MKDGAAQAFLKDKTLRPGDIVVLQDGARVFTGSPDKPHAIKDFAVRRQHLWDRLRVFTNGGWLVHRSP